MRTVLHSDCNNFYASVESVFNPSLRGKPIAVCGDPSERHGIVLAKSETAKRCGVKTGEAIWEARQKCPDLIILKPNGDQYVRFSKMMRSLYAEYTNQIEPFGLDESWLDVTDHPLGGVEIASQLRRRAKEAFGITISVGVSFNKVFAKLGSDMHKPDATTVISPENFREKVWPLPAGELLFIGRKTTQKLMQYGIKTIGDVACCKPAVLRTILGKNGELFYAFANGRDVSPVLTTEQSSEIKSISNSTTPPFDIDNEADARRVLFLLSDNVALRLREQHLKGSTVSIWVRNSELHSFERQLTLAKATNLSAHISQSALHLLYSCWDLQTPLRSLGVRVSELSFDGADNTLLTELDFHTARQAVFEKTLDDIHRRFGVASLQRGCTLTQHHALHAEDIHNNLSASNMSAIHGRGHGI